MDIKTAIEKAIEGGWYLKSQQFWVLENTSEKGRIDANMSSIFLDPSFWESLGKSLGWGEIDNELEKSGMRKEWQIKWHRLIDHLSSGKDIASYFKEIK